ncbi:TerD family protein [Williamsia sp. 1138]|uniref:TerD family protein n=1 Tax=Williamsia sp. 1138 TaxID=1903117 RepID=UPI00143CE1E6|nr:TerD family protein [Williamsia sp. 1138]
MTDQITQALELVRGQNLSLESIGGAEEQIVVGVISEFPSETAARPDVSILLLDGDGKVRTNADFVFYNQREAGGGAVRLVEGTSSLNDAVGSPGEVLVVDFASLPSDVDRIVVGASLDSDAGLTFANADHLEISLLVADSVSPSVVFTLSVEEPVLALLFGEFYRRGAAWKFRALGQGYGDGLGALAQEFGVEIDDDPSTADGPTVQEEMVPANDNGEDATTPPDSEAATATASTVVPDGTGHMTIRKALRPPKLPEWSLRNDLNDESEWDRARLFSVSAIGSGDERERRAVSALLSVMNGVREFGRELVRRSGGPAGTIETFIEPEFDWNEKKYRPDGLIRVTRGAKQWVALVEAKSSTAKLTDDQVEIYVDIARKLGFNAVITVSNQLLGAHDQHPVKVDKRKLKKVSLHHLSWDEIRSVAIQMSMHRQVQDSTQSWVLREFVRYLQHPKSGLHGFTDMGPQWVQVREAVKTRTLNVDNKGAIEVCNLFDQLVRHIGHDLSCLLSTDVRPIFPRNRPDSTSRIQQLADSGMMFGSLRVPGATGPLTLAVDLRSDTVECSTIVDAPREGRPATRVNWVVKQMPDAHGDTLVEAVLPGRTSANIGALLGQLRESPDGLLPADGKLPKQFKITRGHTLSRNRGNVVISANKLVEEFYRDVVQVLRSPKPTKPVKA